MKRAFPIIFLFFLVLIFTSCSTENIKKLYNGYLGFALEIPEDWNVEMYFSENLTGAPEDTADLSMLTLEYDDYGDTYMLIAEVSNNEDEELTAWANSFISAHITDRFNDIEEYAAANYKGNFDEGDFDDYSISLIESCELEANGIAYYKLAYEIVQYYTDSEISFGYDIYISKFNDAFVAMELQYYKNDPISLDFARGFLTRVFKL